MRRGGRERSTARRSVPRAARRAPDGWRSASIAAVRRGAGASLGAHVLHRLSGLTGRCHRRAEGDNLDEQHRVGARYGLARPRRARGARWQPSTKPQICSSPWWTKCRTEPGDEQASVPGACASSSLTAPSDRPRRGVPGASGHAGGGPEGVRSSRRCGCSSETSSGRAGQDPKRTVHAVQEAVTPTRGERSGGCRCRDTIRFATAARLPADTNGGAHDPQSRSAEAIGMVAVASDTLVRRPLVSSSSSRPARASGPK